MRSHILLPAAINTISLFRGSCKLIQVSCFSFICFKGCDPMTRIGALICTALLAFSLGATALAAQSNQPAPPSGPIQIKVVVVTMFERGEDTGDAPGEYQLWVEREHLDQFSRSMPAITTFASIETASSASSLASEPPKRPPQ